MLAGAGIWLLATLSSSGFTNLNSAYQAMGFDPTAPGNSVVVMFSDPHITIPAADGQGIMTNIDYRLVDSVNGMDPPPARIMVTGDICMTYSIVPGFTTTGNWPELYGTNEMLLWLTAIQAFTNIDQTNIVWVPGNHDQNSLETNAEMFCRIFTNMPPYQQIDLGGVRFLLLNGGNQGEPSDSQRQWLKDQMAATSPTQTVAVLIHQSPFAGIACERGNGLMLRESFRDWPARWWVFNGHGHNFGQGVVDMGQSNVVETDLGTVNTNQFNGMSRFAGYLVLCLSNGIAGRIYWHLNDGSFEVMAPPDWAHPKHWVPAFEGVRGLLWSHVKTPAPPPGVIFINSYRDAGYWWIFPYELQWELPLGQFGNQATHFLLLSANLYNDAKVEFSTNRMNWVASPLIAGPNQVYFIAIPPDVANSATGYARYTATMGNNFVGGYGLSGRCARLMPIPDQLGTPGVLLTVTNTAADAFVPPEHLIFTLVTGPDGATLDPLSGVFSWQVPGSVTQAVFNATVAVADSGAPDLSSSQHFVIVVGPYLPPPVRRDYGYALRVYGTPALNYTVLASTNLADWTTLAATNPATMPFEIQDTEAAALPQRFYRVVAVP